MPEHFEVHTYSYEFIIWYPNDPKTQVPRTKHVSCYKLHETQVV